jgi:hypothetical protein
MIVKNYTGLDKAEILDVEGQKYAVGIDDADYLVILSGDVVEALPHNETDDDKIFWADDNHHVQLFPDKLAELIGDSPPEQYQLKQKIKEI